MGRRVWCRAGDSARDDENVEDQTGRVELGVHCDIVVSILEVTESFEIDAKCHENNHFELMWCNVAQCAALLGDVSVAREAMSVVQRVLSEHETSSAADVTTDDDNGKGAVLSGGKRGWHRQSKIRRENRTSDSRSESNSVFRSHRVDQIRRRVETIERFMKDTNRVDLSKRPQYLLKVLSFWSPNKGIVNRRELSKGFLKSLVKRFGLSQLLKRCEETLVEKDMGKRIAKCLTSGTFQVSEYILHDRGRFSKPLNIELGCGSGEWAAAQARVTEGRANWIAELRQPECTTYLLVSCFSVFRICV